MNDVTEQLQKMQKQIESLQVEVRFLKSFVRLPKNATVGSEYVALIYDCDKNAVIRGTKGTGELQNLRIRFNPDGWTKETVDNAHKEYVKSAPERALEAERLANTRKNMK